MKYMYMNWYSEFIYIYSADFKICILKAYPDEIWSFKNNWIKCERFKIYFFSIIFYLNRF